MGAIPKQSEVLKLTIPLSSKQKFQNQGGSILKWILKSLKSQKTKEERGIVSTNTSDYNVFCSTLGGCFAPKSDFWYHDPESRKSQKTSPKMSHFKSFLSLFEGKIQ